MRHIILVLLVFLSLKNSTTAQMIIPPGTTTSIHCTANRACPFFCCVGDTTNFFIQCDSLSNYPDSVYWYVSLRDSLTVLTPADSSCVRLNIPVTQLSFDTLLSKPTLMVNGGYAPPSIFVLLFRTNEKGEVKVTIAGMGFFSEYCTITRVAFEGRRQVCEGDCVSFEDKSNRMPTQHRWYFEGGNPYFSTEKNPKNICYKQPGKYRVKLIVSNPASTDSSEIADYVEVMPRPSVSADTLQRFNVRIGDTTQLAACGTGSRYRWKPTDGLSCSDCASPLAFPKRDVTYRCEVSEESDTLCPRVCRYQMSVLVQDEFVYVPSAFSPNDDGNNDFFTAFSPDITLNELNIYDRWGGLLYRTTTAPIQWDGESAVPGVYVYQLFYTDNRTGSKKIKAGDVTLMK